MPNVKGEIAKLIGVIGGQGWGIPAFGGTPARKDPSKWDGVVKIRDVPKEEIVSILDKVEGLEILDVRET
jgi:hypothetical protein